METYRIVVSTFSISNKDGKMKFFKKNFLLIYVKLDIVFKISFLIIIISWAYDIAHILYLSYFQYNFYFIKSTNSAYLINITIFIK